MQLCSETVALFFQQSPHHRKRNTFLRRYLLGAYTQQEEDGLVKDLRTCLSVRVELFVVCDMKLLYEKSNIYCEIVVKENTVKITHSRVNK